MESTDAILFYVISLLNSGDSSLRSEWQFIFRVVEGEAAIRMKIYSNLLNYRRIAASPSLTTCYIVIPSVSEESPAPLTICLLLLRQKIENQLRNKEFLKFVLSRMERHPNLQWINLLFATYQVFMFSWDYEPLKTGESQYLFQSLY